MPFWLPCLKQRARLLSVDMLNSLCLKLQLTPVRLPECERGALEYLRTCKIFHFAGHGLSDLAKPFAPQGLEGQPFDCRGSRKIYKFTIELSTYMGHLAEMHVGDGIYSLPVPLPEARTQYDQTCRS